MDHAAELPSSVPSRAVLVTRLSIGLVQGLALFGLSDLVADQVPDPRVSAHPVGFGLLVLCATLLPPAVLPILGHARIRVAAAWALAATGAILLLGGYDLRQNGEITMTPASNGLLASLGVILFLGQALVAAAEASRHPWPRYPDCFEAAWRIGLQLALAGCLVLGFWLVYWLGAQLFHGIGLNALNRLGGRLGFVLPVSTALGAAMIHRADAGWRLTLGLRNLLLGVKGWLTPVLTGLVGAFIATLCVTGLDELWRWRDGPAGLAAAAAGLVVLINAVHGDGRNQRASPAILRLSARLASAMLPVLLVLAAWALLGQIDAQGLTQGRVVCAAVLLVLAVHGIAYPAAALRPGMPLLEPANIVAAAGAIVVLAALNSPLADPTRLENESQTGRLLRGAVTPGDFDFDRLARSGRDGKATLAALVRHPDPEIARRAQLAAAPSPDPALATEDTAAVRLRALPPDTALPPGLVAAMRDARPGCVAEDCLARAFPAGGETAWLVGPIGGSFWAMRPDGAGWRLLAIYETSHTCWDRVRTAMLAGEARPVPPFIPDLDLGGVPLRPTTPPQECR